MAFKISNKDQTIKIYNLRADTNEFIGDGDAYIPAGTGLPAHCTSIQPPTATGNTIAVFDYENESWRLVEDHRGKIVYNVQNGNPVEVFELGALPDNCVTVAPPSEFVKWTGSEWVQDAVAEKGYNVSIATAQKANLLMQATSEISPLQDAVDLEMATEEESAKLLAWKKYRVLLNRIDVDDAPDIDWPAQP